MFRRATTDLRGELRMKRWAHLALLSPLWVASAAAQSQSQLPEYRVRLDVPTRTIDAQVTLDVATPTSIHVLFRAEWDGYPGLERRLEKVEAWGQRGPLTLEQLADDAGHHRIVMEASDHVTISFRLVLGAEGPPEFYHRVSQLSDDGGHLIGADFLPRIWLGDSRPGRHPAIIWLTGLPLDWRALSVATRAGTGYEVEDVRAAVFILGALRTRQLNLGPRSLTTGIYGTWPVPDDRVLGAVERIAGALHRIAGDGWGNGRYIVGVGRGPGSMSGMATGGQVIGRSGLVYVMGTAPANLEFERWRHVAAHELTHWYIPTGFRFDGDAPSWFAEGFTDYFALKIQLAGGLMEPDQFLAEIAERLTRYQQSPLYGKTSVAEAEADFWRDDAYRFIYDGGTVAAFLLDLGFQDRGRSLERAVKDVRRDTPITTEKLTAALSGGFRENAWISAWVADGTNPDWDSELKRYKLEWRNGSLVSLNDWVTNALSSIRP